MSTLDTKTLELMASKICHDLISPIGAIGNGLEILEELGPENSEEIIELISSSASLATAKLKAYRVAYGAGGADATIKISDAHHAVDLVLEHEKRLEQDWDASSDLDMGELPPKAFAKMLTALLLLIGECLPRGGTVSASADGDRVIRIAAHGEGAMLKEGFEDCLRGTADLNELSPALTHAYMCGLLAAHYDYGILDVQADGQSAHVTVKAPDF